MYFVDFILYNYSTMHGAKNIKTTIHSIVIDFGHRLVDPKIISTEENTKER
jgi:hypothetical protein